MNCWLDPALMLLSTNLLPVFLYSNNLIKVNSLYHALDDHYNGASIDNFQRTLTVKYPPLPFPQALVLKTENTVCQAGWKTKKI